MEHSDSNPLNELPTMSEEDFVYSRIGMALISTQRVEYITGKLLDYLIEYDKELFGITTLEFLEKSAKSKSAYKTLGGIFMLLKLNPTLVIEDELNAYLKKRNVFVHGFWQNYLYEKSNIQMKAAVDFCYDFGRHSDKIASFFKGFIYFLALRFVKDCDHLEPGIKAWECDFEYFMKAIKQKSIT